MQHSDCNSFLADMMSPFNNTSMVLGKLKKYAGGQRFENHAEVKATVSVRLRFAGGDFCTSGIEKLVIHSRKCLECLEKYIVFCHSCVAFV